MNDIKKLFPIFDENPDLHYLDSAATSLKPKAVLDKMNEYYIQYSANIHRGMYEISERATEEYEEVREEVAKFIGGKTNEVIFTSGTTQSINMVARGLENQFKAGDEIAVTIMEHHSNLVPWQQLCLRTGANLKFIPIDKEKLLITNYELLITKKTKILAITHMSNVLGTVNPIKEIIKKAREINPKIIVVVDGAQAVAHIPVDVKDLGCDFYAFSGHKIYGPTGVGVLWGKEELLDKMTPTNFGGGMIAEVTQTGAAWAPVPERFEGGTPPIGEVIGLGEAIRFILGLGYNYIIEQESDTYSYLITELKKIEGLTLFSGGKNIVSLVVEGVHSHDVAAILDREKVGVRSGHHCAMPLHQVLGVEATTRVSLGIYNDQEDIDALVRGLQNVWTIFTKK
jgi:cysteine desulfurase/selenocysteine lyase